MTAISIPTVSEFIKREKSKPPQMEILEGVITHEPGDYSILAGQSGIGKSVLATQLAFSIATGTPWLGLRTSKVPTVYLGFEGGPQKFADRIEKVAKNYPDPGSYLRLDVVGNGSSIKPFKLPGLSFATDFKNYIDGSKLVILDCMRYLVQGDYCRPMDGSNFTAALQACLREKGAVGVVVHHVRKPDHKNYYQPDDLSSIKGAGDYVDASTSALLLERQKRNKWRSNEDNRILSFYKTRNSMNDMSPKLLLLDRDKLLFEDQGSYVASMGEED